MNLLIIAVLILAVGAAVFLVLRARLKKSGVAADDGAMEGHDFEYYCADLLTGAGFREVQVTRGSGDFGADILAEREGVTYAIQCKCLDGPVGVGAIQEVYAGKAYYGRMVAAVMTNQYFTGPAVELAERLQVLLWDRGYLSEMLEEIRR